MAPLRTPPTWVILNKDQLRNTAAILTRTGHKHADLQKTLQLLEYEANQWLTQGPWTVTSKAKPGPSGNVHDYVSQAPYWWEVNGEYVRRDGQRNPEVFQYSDRWGMEKVFRSTKVLTLAWYFTRNDAYQEHAAEILRTWFVGPDTRMNPHLQNAQVIPGQNEGRPIGIIDFAQGYTAVLDAVATLSETAAPSWPSTDGEAFQRWNEEFLAWLCESEFGKAESNEANNHGDFAALLKAAIAKFLGRDYLAGEIINGEQQRMRQTIEQDGSQPLELSRTRSWHYSCFRLVACVQIAAIGSKMGRNVWEANSSRLLKAAEYLVPAATGQVHWRREELDFQRHAASTLIRAAAIAGSRICRDAVDSLPSVRGDYWPLAHTAEQLDGADQVWTEWLMDKEWR